MLFICLQINPFCLLQRRHDSPNKAFINNIWRPVLRWKVKELRLNLIEDIFFELLTSICEQSEEERVLKHLHLHVTDFAPACFSGDLKGWMQKNENFIPINSPAGAYTQSRVESNLEQEVPHVRVQRVLTQPKVSRMLISPRDQLLKALLLW